MQGCQQLTAETGVNDESLTPVTPISAVSCWQPASQELRQREATNTSWRGPVWASAPLGLRRGARANPVGVVVVHISNLCV